MVKIKIKCKKCGWTADVDVQPSPLAGLKPNDKAKGIKVDWSKDELDKIMDVARGASINDLEQLGIKVKKEDFLLAEERAKIRKFLKEHLRVSKERRKSQGERFQVSSELWRPGDPWNDVDLPTSEQKSMGVDELRLIPGLTLQKREYSKTKGEERDILKGIKFINIIDVSGSMFDRDSGIGRGKIGKALILAEETWKICKKLGFDYNLAIFSDHAHRINSSRITEFFRSETERSKYPGWSGGTSLSAALKLYKMHELKDANLVIISDMDLGDIDQTKSKLQEIGQVTNSFKVILVRHENEFSEEEINNLKSWFPNGEVQVLSMPVRV